MNKTRYSLDRALRLLGKRWTLLIIREACRGPFRFDEICLKLGISRTTLALRLRTLQEEKILKTSPVPNEPNRQYYMLGERGEGLRTVIDRIADWSEGREFDN